MSYLPDMPGHSWQIVLWADRDVVEVHLKSGGIVEDSESARITAATLEEVKPQVMRHALELAERIAKRQRFRQELAESLGAGVTIKGGWGMW